MFLQRHLVTFGRKIKIIETQNLFHFTAKNGLQSQRKSKNVFFFFSSTVFRGEFDKISVFTFINPFFSEALTNSGDPDEMLQNMDALFDKNYRNRNKSSVKPVLSGHSKYTKQSS